MNAEGWKMLTENLLGECWYERKKPYHGCWQDPEFIKCAKCNMELPFRFVETSRSRAEGQHYLPNRTFTTPQDLMDCKDALEQRGLWDEFWGFTLNKYCNSGAYLGANFDKPGSYHSVWLFRTTDENGDTHFCRLVAEFMKERKKGGFEELKENVKAMV